MVTGAKPFESLPNVPPFNTIYPGISGWHGIFAPDVTPKAIVDQIATDVRAAVLSPDNSSRFREMGFEATGVPSERFGEIVRRDYERWGQIIREKNIRMDRRRAGFAPARRRPLDSRQARNERKTDPHVQAQ